MQTTTNLTDVSDSDLLAVCAKAMGFNIVQIRNVRRSAHRKPVLAMQVSTAGVVSNGWNPLENNTDAFDMAVAQGVAMQYCKETDIACAAIGSRGYSVLAKNTQGNRHAALRRAIVIAVYSCYIPQDVSIASA